MAIVGFAALILLGLALIIRSVLGAVGTFALSMLSGKLFIPGVIITLLYLAGGVWLLVIAYNNSPFSVIVK